MGEIAIIGFGEAGGSFAAAAGWASGAVAFDVRDRRAACARAGIAAAPSVGAALVSARMILSLVTARAAPAVAADVAAAIGPGALYFDMNSVAPDTKRSAAMAIEAAGASYIDAAVMAPVHPARLAVPVLLSGLCASAGAEALRAAGFLDVTVVGDAVGAASSIKMIRSVMVKGIEALTAEMMAAARAANVADAVLHSLGQGWAEKAIYNLERMRTHGARRAAEMEEVAKTLAALGVDPLMTRSTIIRQREMGG